MLFLLSNDNNELRFYYHAFCLYNIIPHFGHLEFLIYFFTNHICYGLFGHILIFAILKFWKSSLVIIFISIISNNSSKLQS